MEPTSNQRPRLHPLMATAAISVIVLAAVGVTALVMNRSDATMSPYDAPRAVAQAPAPTPVEPVAAPRVASVPSSTPSTPNYGTNGAAPVTPTYRNDAPVVARAETCRNCGVVDSIREIKVKGEGSGVGAVGGAVVGGLLGNMVGAGRGKALATVGGAVAGGFGGNAIEKNVRAGVEHQMIVRLDDGETRTFTQAAPFPYREGERVRIVNGHAERG